MTESRYEIPGGDYERAGLASRSLKEQLKRIGAAAEIIRRVMIAAYEAEMNAVIHAGGGTMTTVLDDQRVSVEVADAGPGIADIDLAMTEGYSTAPAAARELGFGAGMGLPNIRKSSDRFSIESVVGKGTHVSFTIRLRPLDAGGQKPNSLHVAEHKCTGCLRCLHACPTRALRVRGGRPVKLDHLCVDCSRCMEACAAGALTTAGSAEQPSPAPDNVLVVPPAFLAAFLPDASSRDVLAALGQMGFAQVIVSQGAEGALRAAAMAYAQRAENLPVIISACPAVTNLVEARFPSLIPNVAPYLSPLEAIREELAGRRATFVVLCPAQKTLVALGRGPARADTILPQALEAGVRGLLARRPAAAATAAAPGQEADPRVLQVTGMAHVASVLEEIENGRMTDRVVLEMYACDAGCFGSPVLRKDPFLARWRFLCDGGAPQPGKAVARVDALAGRPGLRLDENMAEAIRKLGQIDRLARSLPGMNCGLCGSPTCAALAEDVLMGRADLSSCGRRGGNSKSGRETTGHNRDL